MKTFDKQPRAQGFSLIELLVVVAIMLVVAAMAIPNVMRGLDDIRLRSGMRDVIGILQQARQQAIKDNTYYTMGLGGANNNLIYIDLNKDLQYNAQAQNCPGANCTPPEPVIQLPTNITLTNAGAPAFNNAAVGVNFNPIMAGGPPSFNARGLPCIVAGGACSSHTGGVIQGQSGANVGFLFFFSQQRTFGGLGWAAIAITPAGRMESWYYSNQTNTWSQQ
jgi:prepilin-type N-terminal cleavage/methylation domain-containing protein